MNPGKITFVSAGTLQGVYRPQVRVYYRNDRHGILFETIEKRIRCRSRKRAIELAKQWANEPDGIEAINQIKARITRNPENSLSKDAA